MRPWGAWLVVAFGALPGRSSAAPADAPRAAEGSSETVLIGELACERAAAPGRVLCEARVRPQRGRLEWADLLVTAAPSFARPLRSRVGLGRAALSEQQTARIRFALVASEPGRGTLQARVRAVVCSERSGVRLCRPAALMLSTELEVGAAP